MCRGYFYSVQFAVAIGAILTVYSLQWVGAILTVYSLPWVGAILTVYSLQWIGAILTVKRPGFVSCVKICFSRHLLHPFPGQERKAC